MKTLLKIGILLTIIFSYSVQAELSENDTQKIKSCIYTNNTPKTIGTCLKQLKDSGIKFVKMSDKQNVILENIYRKKIINLYGYNCPFIIRSEFYWPSDPRLDYLKGGQKVFCGTKSNLISDDMIYIVQMDTPDNLIIIEKW